MSLNNSVVGPQHFKGKNGIFNGHVTIVYIRIDLVFRLGIVLNILVF